MFFCQSYVHGQLFYEFCFDEIDNCYYYPNGGDPGLLPLDINSNSNPNNVWQIGPPQKSVLNNAWSAPKVIVTDTINTYPVNDTSSFTIASSIAWMPPIFHFNFRYFVDSDTLTDFGLIEFSIDNGNSWINLLNIQMYTPYIYWLSNGQNVPPVLSGSSGGWRWAFLDMSSIDLILDFQNATVLLWRFTFISDGIESNRDGLMFDNISIWMTYPVGIEEPDLSSERKLLKVFDMLGRETEIESNRMLIYYYDDGTTEKVVNVE